jgi:exopolysaccharide biosynthesis protein
MVIHIIKVNVAKGSIRPIVTPADQPNSARPYNAQTTTEFAKNFKVQIAINGSGFRPWYDYKLVYFPHSGDQVSPLGTTISKNFYFNAGEDQELPLLMFGGNRPVEIGYIASKAEYAVSGTRMLVDNGEIVANLDNQKLAPRTSVGVDKQGHTLIIVIVDGRQAGYSRGITLKEIARILIDNGADKALELDGGGSSTLVLNRDGSPVVLNSPIHQGIPGKERPVANHIGFIIK